MKAPIIADNRGDVLVFDTVSEAETYIEPVDAENNEYEVFDSEGRRLRIDVVEERWHERVRLELPETSVTDEAGLKSLLLDFLSRTRIEKPEHAEDLSLAECIALLPRTR